MVDTLVLSGGHGEVLTKSKGDLTMNKPRILAARGLESESIIALWNNLRYSDVACPAVAVYPYSYTLNPKRIMALSKDFSGNIMIDAPRKFRNKSVRELSKYFFDRIKPQMSLTDLEFLPEGNLVLVHLFAPNQYGMLKDNINNLIGATA
jgi:hypothetical protein